MPEVKDENAKVEETREANAKPNAKPNAKSTTYLEPKTFQVKGEILAVDDMVDSKGVEKGVMVKIEESTTGKEFRAVTSDGMMQKFSSNGQKYADIVVKGSTCTATLAETIEGVTGYTDKETGKEDFHTKTGSVLREITPMSTIAFSSINRRKAENDKHEVNRENMPENIKVMKKSLIEAGFTDEEVRAAIAQAIRIG